MINPWIFDFAAFDLWIRPLGLLYLGAILKNNGYEVKLINCLDRYNKELSKSYKINDKKFGTGHFYKEIVEKPEVIKFVQRKFGRYGITEQIFINELNKIKNPDIILLSSGMTYWYRGPKRALEILRAKFPKIPVLFGGIYPTLAPEHAEKNIDADEIIRGEAETKIIPLLKKYIDYDPPGNNDYNDINNIPFPAYDLEPNINSILLLTSRGCPFRCTFCGSHLISGKFRQRDPENVRDEISYHRRTYKLRDYVFFDDALFFNKEKHIYPILKFIIEKKYNLRLHTPNGIHPKEIDETAAKLMFEAGFKTVRLSLETVNSRRYGDMGFKVDKESFAIAVKNLEKSGFKRKNIESYIIMALPEQEPQEVIDTIIYSASLGIKARLCSFSPIPGTVEWEKALETGDLNKNKDLLLMNNTVYPLLTKNFGYEIFNGIKRFSQICNYASEHGGDFFKIIKRSDIFKKMRDFE